MADLRSTIIGINATLIVLTSTAISCRIGRRAFLVRLFHWHDGLISLAAFSAIVFSLLQITSTRYGLGQSMVYVSAKNLQTIIKLGIASRVFYFVCNWAVKHSLLFFYAELTIDKWPRRAIGVMHGVAFAFGLSNVLVTLLECVPLRAAWEPEVQGRCIDVNKFNYYNSIFMLVTDVVLYAMPIVFTLHLRLHRAQRLCANVLFALGALVLVASGVRVYSVDAQAKHPDMTYRYAMTIVCAVVENHLAVVVACAPSIKVTVLHSFPWLTSRLDKIVSSLASKKSTGSSYASQAGDPAKVERDLQGIRLSSKPMTTGKSESNKSTKHDRWWHAPSTWDVDEDGDKSLV